MTRRALWLTVLILITAAALRAWNLDAQSLWFDEAFSWHAAAQPDLITTLNGDPTNPPFYYLLLHIWMRLLGESEFALRVFSLLQGILLLALVAFMARRWFGSKTGMLAAALGAFLPLLWWASQEARMYNTLATAVLVMAAGLVRLLQDDSPPHWAWLALLAGELAALYTHNTGIVVVGAVNAVAIAVWVVRTLRQRNPRPRWLLRWILGQAAVLLLWLPEYAARFSAVGGANTASAAPPAVRLDLLWQTWQGLWAQSWEMVRLDHAGFAALLLPLLVIALLPLRSLRGRLLFGLAVSLYVALIGALIVIGNPFHSRYVVMIAPLWIILLAAGASYFRPGLLTMRSVAVVLITVLALVWLLVPGRPDPQYQHDDARAVVAYYADTLPPEGRILTWSYAERYELRYYLQRYGMAGQMVTLPEGVAEDAAIAMVNAALPQTLPAPVEVNTWFTQRADARGMLGCLLEHGQPAPQETFSAFGMTTTRHQVTEPLTAPEPFFEKPVVFGPVQLDGVHYINLPVDADTGYCLRFDFTLLETTPDNLAAAVNALNPPGWAFTSADAPLLTQAQIPTSQLSPGDQVQAYALLRFPYGTPPGDYPLQVRLYSANQQNGIDAHDPEDGTPLGRDVGIGAAALNAAAWPPPDCAIDITGGLQAACGSFQQEAVTAGQTLRYGIVWQVEGEALPVTLTLRGEGWQAESTRMLPANSVNRDWRAVSVPAEASGAAELTVNAGNTGPVTVAAYPIAAPERLFATPEVETILNAALPELGRLYGFSLPEGALRSGRPFTVALAWQAETATQAPLKITVQLLDDAGQLIAQHDSEPAGGQRPTTSWVAGEYILDRHQVTFLNDQHPYNGPARLIVAVYDPANNQRILAEDGQDHLVLRDDLHILP